MAHKIPWHIFVKCFHNQASKEEIAELKEWLDEDSDNISFLEEIHNIYTVSTVLPPVLAPNMKKAWETINKKTQQKNSTWQTIQKTIKPIAAIAAVLIIFFLGLKVINAPSESSISTQYAEVFTQPGEKTSVKLPDGTTVWLNSSSSLKYSFAFNHKEREVELTGEAYFQVAKNKSKRFRVKSGALYVDVYGTSFDVKNYPDINQQEITVAEGIVGISDHTKEFRKITKGEKAMLDKQSGVINFTTDDPELVSAWKNNELVFKDTPIKDVIKALESWYGVNIKYEKQMMNKHSYSFKIKTESFKEVMDMMKIMTPFEYKINGKDVELKYK
jgi:ferric-dicitrate binding protein FerR (iron transport regulator)